MSKIQVISSCFTYLISICFITPLFAQAPFSIDQLEKLANAIQIINFAYVDSIDQNKLVENSINGMLEKLDPHSVYISTEELQEMNEPLEGNFEGIGIQFNILRDTIVVVNTVAGGPSERIGILPGDKIIRIEGQNVAGLKIKNPDVMKKLRGGQGSTVSVTVIRKNSKKNIEYVITREKIPIYSIDASYLAAPQVGYIKLSRFAQTSIEEFTIALEKLRTQGAKDLILDLSDNGGGYLTTAIELADEFLEEQKLIVYTEGAFSPKQLFYSTVNGHFEKGRLIVLIDEGSASASEIVAGAVQDLDRGLIIGRRSFGKGLVQKPFSLPDGSMLRLTTAYYYTPAGRNIQKPYTNGSESYYNDIYNRFTNGELTSKDSIHFHDSLKYYTANKRLVYGGGGIMPDIFIPLDTTKTSEYHNELIQRSILTNFTFDYLDKNRQQFLTSYPIFEDFKRGFKIDKKIFDDLVAYADKEGIKRDDKGLDISKDLLSIQIKALIARDLWQNDAFYHILNELNPSYQKALEAMKYDAFKKYKITAN